jgi:hypothetical protein
MDMENGGTNKQKSTPIKKKRIDKGKIQKAFLAAYEECGNITAAAQMAEMDRSTHYKWMREDDDYPELFNERHLVFVEIMEAEARRRAIDGVEVPIYWQGRRVGEKQQYSDTLMIFLLKGEMPDKYKERGEQEVKHSGQIHNNDLSKIPVEELERIAGIDPDGKKSV